MTEKTVTKYKWFWAWQDDKEEAWLSEMAQQGFHLISANFIGNYTFKTGNPKKTTYRMDFFYEHQDKYQEYLQLFKDGGWKLVCTFGGWQYFCIEQNGAAAPEIYTDRNSKIVKYQRVMVYLSIFFPLMFIAINLNPDVGSVLSWIYNGVRILIGLYFFLYVFAMVKLIQRIQQIKKEELTEKK